MIDYRMQTFITLCELMNYRLTAEKLNMTQPAVTQHIKYLEKQYQTKLFIYDGKSLIKTEKAKCLEKSTRTMYMLEKELKVQMDEAKEDPIIMGATKTIAEFAVSKMILEYLNQTKQDFELVVDNTENLLDKIDHGEIDFALIEGYFNKNDYAYQLLERQPFVGICSKDHPFAKKEVSMEEILKETILIRSEERRVGKECRL